MTMIVHRCSKCRRVDWWCDGTTVEPVGEREGERKCCRDATWSAPELMTRYRLDTYGVPITELLPPGGAAPSGARSCRCQTYRAFYEAQRVVTVQPAGGVL